LGMQRGSLESGIGVRHVLNLNKDTNVSFGILIERKH
jgi:hypothetical protein